jgi:hypothetical protein
MQCISFNDSILWMVIGNVFEYVSDAKSVTRIAILSIGK